jgi:prephenate dehydratase
VSLTLDCDTLKDLRAPAAALDHLEVNLQAVAGLKARDAAQLVALDRIDDGAHDKKEARTRNPRLRAQQS